MACVGYTMEDYAMPALAQAYDHLQRDKSQAAHRCLRVPKANKQFAYRIAQGMIAAKLLQADDHLLKLKWRWPHHVP
jgi:hypothetical protein